MMVALTHDAQGHLERYLRQIKAALRGHPTVDAGEVERDVLGHIDAELAGKPEPVNASSLREVLDRLGTPDRWVPAEDLPVWRRALNRLHSGPEDWRLAYLTFASFIGGFWLPPLFIASLPLARATLAQFEASDERDGPRRWLVYPPLVFWYGAFATAILVSPIAAVVVPLEEPAVRSQVERFIPGPFWLVMPSLAVLAVGIWWTILGPLLGRFRNVVQLVFWPFANWFERRHALRLSLAGICVIVISAAVLLSVRAWM